MSCPVNVKALVADLVLMLGPNMIVRTAEAAYLLLQSVLHKPTVVVGDRHPNSR
jgi:hypothetical protein